MRFSGYIVFDFVFYSQFCKNWNDRIRTCLRFRPFIAISLHQLSYVPTTRRLLPCVLIRNKFSDLFFVVVTAMPGIEPKKFENTLERKSLYACHRQNEAEASEKYNKYKGDINERNRGRDSNPQRLYDTLILQVTIYQF